MFFHVISTLKAYLSILFTKVSYLKVKLKFQKKVFIEFEIFIILLSFDRLLFNKCKLNYFFKH